MRGFGILPACQPACISHMLHRAFLVTQVHMHTLRYDVVQSEVNAADSPPADSLGVDTVLVRAFVGWFCNFQEEVYHQFFFSN